MTSYKTVILDFDGVIVESLAIKDKAFEEVFKDFPTELPEIMKYHRAHNAIIRYEKFRYIYEVILQKPYTAEIAERLSAQFSHFVFEQIVSCPYVRGAKEFLDEFQRHVLLYLVSINPPQELRRILAARKLDGYFTDVYAHPWPKADAIRDILRRNNFEEKEAIFIGDSPEDFKAAQMAGIGFLARQSDKSWSAYPVKVFPDMFACMSQLMKN